jgi:uncharacterized protein
MATRGGRRSEKLDRATTMPQRLQQPFHVMTKPRGALCNLDCHYCFYLQKEALYPHSTMRMTDELLERYVRQYIEAHADAAEVTFAWQGGEPTLMGLAFFQQAVQLQQRYRRPGQRILNALQTNGVLLDDDWGRFLQAHEFLVGVSLDGPPDLHDIYRRDKGGQPTFDRVRTGIDLLQRHAVPFNILTCVNDANARRPLSVYRFLRDEIGAEFIQFIPIVEPAPGPALVSPRSVDGAAYGAFLIAIFDEWVRRDVGRVAVQIFEAALGIWSGCGPGLCIFDETCGRGLALEHNGDVYACDHFVTPAHLLGNVRTSSLIELVDSPAQVHFGQAKRDTLPAVCRRCPVRFACNGGCPKDRLLASVDGEAGLNYLCAGYKAFFSHIDRAMQGMALLLRAGRDPATIMRVLATVQPHSLPISEQLAHHEQMD